jgi:hypothetical protein
MCSRKKQQKIQDSRSNFHVADALFLFQTALYNLILVWLPWYFADI